MGRPPVSEGSSLGAVFKCPFLKILTGSLFFGKRKSKGMLYSPRGFICLEAHCIEGRGGMVPLLDILGDL